MRNCNGFRFPLPEKRQRMGLFSLFGSRHSYGCQYDIISSGGDTVNLEVKPDGCYATKIRRIFSEMVGSVDFHAPFAAPSIRMRSKRQTICVECFSPQYCG